MAKRYVETKFWDDTYISNLDPSEKLLFLYLMTNPCVNIAGVYEISLKRIALDTGFDKEMTEKMLTRFEEDKKIIYYKGFICFNNWTKHQTMNDSVKQGIERVLKIIPENIVLQAVSVFGTEWGQSGDTLPYLTLLNLTIPNSTQLLPPNGGDFIEQLISIFSEEYKKAFGFDYIVTNKGKERTAVGKILTAYKAKNKDSGSEKCLSDFRNLFSAVCHADYKSDKFLAQVDLPKLNSQLNKYLQFLHKDLKEKNKWERV